MTDDHAETPLVNRDALARALFVAVDDDFIEVFPGEDDDDPGYVSVQALRDRVADAVLAALPTPAEYVRGLADDETLLLRCARSLNMYAGADEADDFAVMLRALAAALTERTDR